MPTLQRNNQTHIIRCLRSLHEQKGQGTERQDQTTPEGGQMTQIIIIVLAWIYLPWWAALLITLLLMFE